MNLKVLPLPYWAHYGIDLWADDRYQEINPIFYRNGIYLSGDECWLEIDGRAYTYDAKQFKFDIALMDAERYNEKQYNALREIHRENLATKKQRELLYFIEAARQIRNTTRSNKKLMRRMLT